MTPLELTLGLIVGLVLALLWRVLHGPVHLSAAGEAGLDIPAYGKLGVGWGPVGLEVRRERDEERALLTVFLFSRRLLGVRLSGSPKEKHKECGGAGGLERARRVLARIDRHLGLAEIARFLIAERRRIAIDHLRGRLRFGFDDFAQTGELSGYLWAIRSVTVPFPGGFEHVPDWSGRRVFALGGQVRVRVYWVALARDVGLLLIARTRRRKPAPASVASADRAASGAAG